MFNRIIAIAEKERLEGEIRERVDEYNVALSENDKTKADGAYIAAKQLCNEYVYYSKCIKFDDLLNEADPIAAACREYVYDVLSIKDEQTESLFKPKKVETTQKVIDLIALKKFAKQTRKINIGSDDEWVDVITGLNYLMTIKAAKELGIDPEEIRNCYRITDMAKEYATVMNNAADTNELVLAWIKNIADMMLSEEHRDPGMQEVMYLNRIWSKKGKKCLQIQVADHKKMVAIVMEICHKLLTGEAYSLDYKRAKGK